MSWLDLKSKGLRHMPGIPEPTYQEIFDTVNRLRLRKGETDAAVNGLSERFTIGGHTVTGKDFLYGAANLKNLPLEHSVQYSIGWTTFKDVRKDAQKDLGHFAYTLVNVDAATKSFWPTIAHCGTAYNLLMLRKVTDARFREFVALLSPAENYFRSIVAEGRLYELDFSLFQSLRAYHSDNQAPRFNPATFTLLERTDKGELVPIWIQVWNDQAIPGFPFGPNKAYSPKYPQFKPGSWMYALQAAKTSVTLYGIWLGHVYHWHMVTAAMQRTMFDHLPADHAVFRLLAPQSSYLIPFDYVLLDGAPFPLSRYINFKEIAPPSCIGDVNSFLQLTDKFAKGREFFDDDPKTELAKQGIEQADFSRDQPWDRYPVAQNLLKIWDICEEFVTAVVAASYNTDSAVAQDAALQNWMRAAADPNQGNIRGLPTMNSRTALNRVLTSLVYRMTAHGISRLVHSANPALTFVGNFPPCLQREDIPSMEQDLSAKELLTYMPNTWTIGDMLNFYFAFAFSKPYVPLIPLSSFGTSAPGFEYYYPGDVDTDPRNAALLRFRSAMERFMGTDNVPQWPRNIET
jgi:hypothetical protein